MRVRLKNWSSMTESMVPAVFFLAAIYWVLDSIINIFFSNRFNIIAELVGPDTYNVYVRIVVLCLFIIFGSHAQTTINKLRQTRDSLRESEERYRALFTNNPVQTYVVDDQAQVVDHNLPPVNADHFWPIGREMEFRDFSGHHPVDMPAELQECIRSGSSMTYTVQRSDGRHLHLRIAPFSKGAIVTSIDLTAQKILERRLEQTQKMESIATLAGGIAHQFNNILGGISGNVELMRMSRPNAMEAQSYEESILQLTQRMSRLTNQLLAFARRGMHHRERVHVDKLVDDTLELLKHSIDKKVAIEARTIDTLPPVHADASQVQTVLTAVVANAAEAIEGRGRIHITMQAAAVDTQAAAKRPGFKPGRYVLITVEDNGRGMTAETVAKIFEPFYTTNFLGRGLGMAAAYGIVKSHAGWIGVESKSGAGTTVSIFLPTAESSVSATTRSAVVDEQSQTILLVEDEPQVLLTSSSFLESMGYRVLQAETGNKALDFLSTDEEVVDLIILDIGLPDMRGDYLLNQIHEMGPRPKIIVSTGYALDEYDLNAPFKVDDHIQKPYLFSTLASKVKTLLDGS